MPQLVIITKRIVWPEVVKALVQVPKKITVQCRESGPDDPVRDYPVHAKFCSMVEPGLREDLLSQLRERFANIEASDLPVLFGWVKKGSGSHLRVYPLTL